MTRAAGGRAEPASGAPTGLAHSGHDGAAKPFARRSPRWRRRRPPAAGALACRYVGASVERAHLAFRGAWEVLRQRCFGVAAVTPRIWST